MYVKRAVPWMFAALIALVPVAANAAVYPINKCVSAKQLAAAKKCQAYLKAYNVWFKSVATAESTTKLNNAKVKATSKFTSDYLKADDKASAKGFDCSDTTAAYNDVEADVDDAIDSFVATLTDGLDPMNADHLKCASAIANAAANKCQALLKAQSKFIKQPSSEGATKRDEAIVKATTKFTEAYTKATESNCPTNAAVGTLEGIVDDLMDAVVAKTTTSPNIDDAQFTTITHGTVSSVEYQGRTFFPKCSGTTPYSYFVKRGSENKLLVYYQGGGACWDGLTCGPANTFDRSVVTVGTCTGGSNSGQSCELRSDCPDSGPGTNCSGTDNPGNASAGFSDVNNPANPFKDWNIVFVSYCTGDIHFGDSAQTYANPLGGTVHIEHRGYVNARVVEKFTREHFLNPDEVFVTGSSAGAYGALFNAPLLREIYPAAKFNVLGDAGNGVVTQQFLDNEFPKWNFAGNLPDTIPGLADTLTNGTGIPGYIEVVANFFPDVNWANYTSAYDGGTGGQTGFYHVMKNPTSDVGTALAVWPKWWEDSCAWNDAMTQQAIDTAAAVPNNYRYYIGTGSRHTMWGSNKVYTDTSGGVPRIVDWINAMRDSTPAWVNVETTTPGVLLSGDPRQNGNPPPAPFVDDNADNTADRIVCP